MQQLETRCGYRQLSPFQRLGGRILLALTRAEGKLRFGRRRIRDSLRPSSASIDKSRFPFVEEQPCSVLIGSTILMGPFFEFIQGPGSRPHACCKVSA